MSLKTKESSTEVIYLFIYFVLLQRQDLNFVALELSRFSQPPSHRFACVYCVPVSLLGVRILSIYHITFSCHVFIVTVSQTFLFFFPFITDLRSTPAFCRMSIILIYLCYCSKIPHPGYFTKTKNIFLLFLMA